MSDSPGIENFSGSDSTRATRHSYGKPNPMTVPSFENDRNTIRPTRNFTRPRTNASLLRGSVAANARTSSTVSGTASGYELSRSLSRHDATGGARTSGRETVEDEFEPDLERTRVVMVPFGAVSWSHAKPSPGKSTRLLPRIKVAWLYCPSAKAVARPMWWPIATTRSRCDRSGVRDRWTARRFVSSLLGPGRREHEPPM